MPDYGATDRVRSSATVRYVRPARQKRQKTFLIHSGTFTKALVEDGALAPNRYPIVCNALRSRRFLEENHLRLLEERTNADSGLSSDVTFVYSLEGGLDTPGIPSGLLERFGKLRGILKESYAAAGGAEKVIQTEREAWDR